MPTLICPHCQSPQAVSDEVYQKNVGKKCRCRQCQKPFTIEVAPPPPAVEEEGFGNFDFLNEDSPAVAKPSTPAKPTVAAPASPAPQPTSDVDFSYLTGDGPESPPVAAFPDFHSPDQIHSPASEAAAAPAFPAFDDEPLASSAAKNKSGPKAKPQVTEPRQSVGDDEGVASLPNRPALRLIATFLRAIGWVHLVFVAMGLLLGLLMVVHAPTTEAKVSAVATVLMMTLALITSAVLWFALSELIHLGLGMEARLYEISCRTQPRG